MLPHAGQIPHGTKKSTSRPPSRCRYPCNYTLQNPREKKKDRTPLPQLGRCRAMPQIGKTTNKQNAPRVRNTESHRISPMRP